MLDKVSRDKEQCKVCYGDVQRMMGVGIERKLRMNGNGWAGRSKLDPGPGRFLNATAVEQLSVRVSEN